MTAGRMQTGEDRFRLAELWDGVLIEHGPSEGQAPFLTTGILARLSMATEKRGWVVGRTGGWLLRTRPDRLLSANVAYVSLAKLASWPTRGFPRVVPDFVVEVRASNHAPSRAIAKAGIWIAHGVPVVWVLDVVERTGLVLRGYNAIDEVDPHGVFRADPVLPDFALSMDEIFRPVTPDRE